MRPQCLVSRLEQVLLISTSQLPRRCSARLVLLYTTAMARILPQRDVLLRTVSSLRPWCVLLNKIKLVSSPWRCRGRLLPPRLCVSANARPRARRRPLRCVPSSSSSRHCRHGCVCVGPGARLVSVSYVRELWLRCPLLNASGSACLLLPCFLPETC